MSSSDERITRESNEAVARYSRTKRITRSVHASVVTKAIIERAKSIKEMEVQCSRFAHFQLSSREFNELFESPY